MNWIYAGLKAAKVVGGFLYKLTRLRRMQNTTLGGITGLAAKAYELFPDMTPAAAIHSMSTWTIAQWYVQLPQILVCMGIILYNEDGQANRVKKELEEAHKKELDEIYQKKINIGTASQAPKEL